jgi:hypothetical protein
MVVKLYLCRSTQQILVTSLSGPPTDLQIVRDVCVELMPVSVDPTTRSLRGKFTRWRLFG